MRIGDITAKFIQPTHLNEIDYEICFVASKNVPQVIAEIKQNNFIPNGKYVVPALEYANFALVGRFVNFCDQNPAFKNENSAVYEFVKNHKVQMYPYDWFDNFKNIPIEIRRDDSCGMLYAIYKGKRMYYPQNYSAEMIANSINFFVKEQLTISPHCYMPDNEHAVKKGDIVVDGGAAEANFSLDVIDRARKIYLYEGDPNWIPALQMTFRDYRDKVVIINKFLDSYAHKGYATIDDTVSEREVNFIKLDVEGYELQALCGAKKHIMASNNFRCSICAYHNHEDAEVLPIYLKTLNCECRVGKGKLFRTDNSIWQSEVPDLRVGMIYAKKF